MPSKTDHTQNEKSISPEKTFNIKTFENSKILLAYENISADFENSMKNKLGIKNKEEKNLGNFTLYGLDTNEKEKQKSIKKVPPKVIFKETSLNFDEGSQGDTEESTSTSLPPPPVELQTASIQHLILNYTNKIF